MSIIDLLKTGHNQQQQMMQQILDCQSTEERERLFRSFIVEMSFQKSAVERFLLIPLERAGITVLPNKKAHEAQLEFNQKVDDILNLPNDHTDWLPKTRALFTELDEYIKDNGQRCFSELEKELSDDTKQKLAKDYMDYMDNKPPIMIYA